MTCKDLLTGEINENNKNKLNNFNVLSIHKDKEIEIDENIYNKNLIISKDIINQLIIQKKYMMDFSYNIKVNDAYEKLKKKKFKY